MTLLWLVMFASLAYGAVKLFGGFKRSPKWIDIIAWIWVIFSFLAVLWLWREINDAKHVRAKQYKVTRDVKECTLDKSISNSERMDCIIEWIKEYSDLEDELHRALYR